MFGWLFSRSIIRLLQFVQGQTCHGCINYSSRPHMRLSYYLHPSSIREISFRLSRELNPGPLDLESSALTARPRFSPQLGLNPIPKNRMVVMVLHPMVWYLQRYLSYQPSILAVMKVYSHTGLSFGRRYDNKDAVWEKAGVRVVGKINTKFLSSHTGQP